MSIQLEALSHTYQAGSPFQATALHDINMTIRDGELLASYIYPTRGDKVMELAMNILEKRAFKRENLLSSALVTSDNANVLLMQNDEMKRQVLGIFSAEIYKSLRNAK